MTIQKISVEGDIVTQYNAHSPGEGAGSYAVTPVTLQNFIFINGKLIIVDGQTYAAHGTATVNASSSFIFINGLAVARDGDSVSHHHANNGIHVIGQAFVFG